MVEFPMSPLSPQAVLACSSFLLVSEAAADDAPPFAVARQRVLLRRAKHLDVLLLLIDLLKAIGRRILREPRTYSSDWWATVGRLKRGEAFRADFRLPRSIFISLRDGFIEHLTADAPTETSSFDPPLARCN
jgi:hypothetical protein